MSSIIATTAVRGRFLDIKNTVAQAREIHDQVRYVEDGLLISQNGEIQWFGSWEEGQQHLPEGVQVAHYPEQLVPSILNQSMLYLMQRRRVICV